MLTTEQMVDFATGYKMIEALGVLKRDMHIKALDHINILCSKFVSQNEKESSAKSLSEILFPDAKPPVEDRSEMKTLDGKLVLRTVSNINKIAVIKYLRQYKPGLSLKEGKDLVDNCPSVIFQGTDLTWHRANLEQLGCKVDITSFGLGTTIPQRPLGSSPNELMAKHMAKHEPFPSLPLSTYARFFGYFIVGESRLFAADRIALGQNGTLNLNWTELNEFLDLAAKKIDDAEVELEDGMQLPFVAFRRSNEIVDMTFYNPKIK